MVLTLSALGGALASAGKFIWNNKGAITSALGLGKDMGLFGNLFGSSGNSAREAAQLQYENNLKLQKQAQKWNEKMYKNRYQWQVNDLEAAGINKLYGLGTAPSVTSGTTSASMPDMVGEQSSKREQLLKLLDFGATYSAKRAEGKLLEQQANTEYYNTQIRALEVYTQQLTNLQKKKDLDWTDRKNMAEINNLISQTRKNLAEANMISLQSMPYSRYENMIKRNPKFGEYAEKLDRLSVSAKLFTNILKSGGIGLKYLIGR